MKQMGHDKVVFLITTLLLVFTAVFFYTIRHTAEEIDEKISHQIVVEETWTLPMPLNEISGMVFMEPNYLLCVQDEEGAVFIYDLETASIEKKIVFTEPGDFEGIAMKGEKVYVLEANGTLYEINDLLGAASSKKFSTGLTVENDCEGLFYDAKKDRLLVSVKEKDPNSKDFKGIYALDWASKKIGQEPIYKLSFEDKMFDSIRKKSAEKTFYPSEIGINPASGEILVLEAREPRLLLLDASGKPKSFHLLHPGIFPQPEGIAFDKTGNIYISNEGKPGTIHRISIKE